MRPIKLALLTLCLLLSLGGTGAGAILPDLTNWGGPSLLSLLQNQINGKLTAQEVSGNPLSGLVFKYLAITGPDGQVVFAVDRLEARLSLASILNFHLDLGTLVLENPRFYLSRDPSGQWNFNRLIKKAEKPAEPPGLAAKIARYFFQDLDLSNLQVHRGELFITEDGHTTRYSDLDLKARLALLKWGQPQQKIDIDIANLRITAPQGQAELEARLTYSSGLARISAVNLKLDGRTVVSLQGEVCPPLNKAGFSCAFTGKIGPLPGDKIHALWSRWPAPWDLDGALSLSTNSEGGEIRLNGKIGAASIDLTGNLHTRVTPAVFALDLDLEGLTTAQLQEVKVLKAPQIQGLSPVDAHLRLRGTGLPWNPESMESRLTLAPFCYKDLKVDKAQLDLSGNAGRQTLQATLAGNFGAVDLDAKGKLLPLGDTAKGLAGDLTLKTKDFQPAMVGAARLAGSSLTTNFTGKFRLPPGLSPAQAYLAGDLQTSGRLNKEPLRNLKAGFVLDGNKLTISQADVQVADLMASFRGTLDRSGLDVTFGATMAGSRILPLPSGTTFASLKADGAVRGPWKNPQVNLTAQAHRLSFQGNTLESANLNGSLTGWPPQSGSLKLSGSQFRTAAGAFTRFNLNAGGDGGRWQFQLAATSPKLPTFELAGTADLAGRPLTLNIARANWHSQALSVKNTAPFQIRLFPGWEITPATFQVDGGALTFAGLARDQELTGRLELHNLNAGLLAPLGLPASGKLNGQLTLTGNPRAPIIDGQIALSSGKLQNIAVQTMTTTLNYQTERAQVSGYLEIGPLRSRLIWKGTVPVKISLAPFAFVLAHDGLDLQLHSERVNLSMLTSFSKDVQTAEGPIDLSLQARGNPYQPRVSGYVRWSAGSLQLQKAGTRYRLDPGEIRLQGDRIVVPGLVIRSDGTLRLSGEIMLAATSRAQARLQADNFQALDRGGNALWANGSVDLTGPLFALVANGRLIVPKAQFRPTFFRSGMDPDVILVPLKPKPAESEGTAPAIYRNLSVNITIDSTGNAWLIDPMGKVEMAAHLRVKKDPGQKLALGGEIRALNGTLDVQERPFKVERAVLRLPGVPGKIITVDAKAVHEMDDITLVLNVNGALTNPQIHLESLPPLPPADVLSYLVFGAPAATLTKEQYMAMGAQTLGVLGGITPQKIDEIIGSTIPFLSGIKVRSGMVSGRPSVNVGKEIVKNVSVFVGRNLNEERGVYEQQVGIQYKVNKNLSVESQIGHRNSGADVLFNYDF